MSLSLSRLFEDGTSGQTDRDGVLFHRGAPVRAMYLLEEGRMDLVRYTNSGTRLSLFQASSGAVLAEASAYSPSYHCDCVALRPARWRAVSVAVFRARLDADPKAASLWAETLAHGLQKARMGSEIRTLRTVADRLDAWLAAGHDMPPKGERQDLAQALGVTREALYRELAKRR